MKNFNLIKNSVLVLILMSFLHPANAETPVQDSIPNKVVSSFTLQYAGVKIDKWRSSKNNYAVKFALNRHIYWASYDSSGVWQKTISKVKWPWHLPLEVRTALKKSEHSSWNIYGVSEVETPNGKFYRIIVNNENHPVDIFHQGDILEWWSIEIKRNGALIGEKKY